MPDVRSIVPLHPLYNGEVGSQFDLVMGTLDSVPNPPIGPLPVLLSETTGPGSRITAFGYGTNEVGATGELKAADFTVDRLGGGHLIVFGNGEESICPRDSGGPAVYVKSQGVSAKCPKISFMSGLGQIEGAEEPSPSLTKLSFRRK